MKKIVLTLLLSLFTIFTISASGIGSAYDNKIVNKNADASTKEYFDNATHLALLRINLEKSIEKTSKIAFTQKIALKSVLNKVKKAEQKASDFNRLVMLAGIGLMILGLITMIIGGLNAFYPRKFALLQFAEKAGIGMTGGGGLFLLGFGIWLLGKYA
jgi:hypothetical protein